METRSLTCVSRNVRHVGDGEPLARTRYFSTVDFATTMPTLATSPTIRAEPQLGLAREIWRIRVRISGSMAGRPGRPSAPVVAKAALLPLEDRPWLNEPDSLAPFRPEASKPRPQHPVPRLNPESPRPASLVDRELVPQRNNLQVQREASLEHGGEEVPEGAPEYSHDGFGSGSTRQHDRRAPARQQVPGAASTASPPPRKSRETSGFEFSGGTTASTTRNPTTLRCWGFSGACPAR